MKIFVSARPNTKKEKVEKTDETHLVVAVKEPPKNGRANAAIAKALAGYLNVPSSRIRLESGFSSRSKVFELL